MVIFILGFRITFVARILSCLFSSLLHRAVGLFLALLGERLTPLDKRLRTAATVRSVGNISFLRPPEAGFMARAISGASVVAAVLYIVGIHVAGIGSSTVAVGTVLFVHDLPSVLGGLFRSFGHSIRVGSVVVSTAATTALDQQCK